MALEDVLKRLVLDPCNRSAERRNFAAIRDGFTEIVNEFTTINNTIINNTTTGSGDSLKLFEVNADNQGASTTTATELVWDGATWGATGSTWTIHDWSANQMFSNNFLSGHQGIGRINTDVGSTDLEVVFVEGQARFLEVTLTEDMGATTAKRASATVNEFWGAYPNIHDPGANITVHDTLDKYDDAKLGDKMLCLLDEDNVPYRYVIIDAKKPTQDVRINLVKIKQGTGLTQCDYVEDDAKCLWDAVLSTVNAGGATMCDPFSDGSSIWVIDGRECGERLGELKYEEHYLAYYSGYTFDPGADERDLWIIRSGEPPGARIGTVKINTDDQVQECDDVEDNAKCLWSAKLRRFQTQLTTLCAPFEHDYDVWVMDTRVCNDTGELKQGEQYMAYFADFSFSVDGDNREVWVIRSPDKKTLEIDGEMWCCEICEQTSCCSVGDDYAIYRGTIRRHLESDDYCDPDKEVYPCFVLSACKNLQVGAVAWVRDMGVEHYCEWEPSELGGEITIGETLKLVEWCECWPDPECPPEEKPIYARFASTVCPIINTIPQLTLVHRTGRGTPHNDPLCAWDGWEGEFKMELYRPIRLYAIKYTTSETGSTQLPGYAHFSYLTGQPITIYDDTYTIETRTVTSIIEDDCVCEPLLDGNDDPTYEQIVRAYRVRADCTTGVGGDPYIHRACLEHLYPAGHSIYPNGHPLDNEGAPISAYEFGYYVPDAEPIDISENNRICWNSTIGFFDIDFGDGGSATEDCGNLNMHDHRFMQCFTDFVNNTTCTMESIIVAGKNSITFWW